MTTTFPHFAHFPRRRFVCVGDSGEQDPEMYGDLARDFPHQIRGIFIRNVTGETIGNARLQLAFRDIPSDRCMLFDAAAELPSVPPRM